MKPSYNLANSEDISILGVKHLLRYWQKCQLTKNNVIQNDTYVNEWNSDITLLAALGLGLEQTIQYIYTEATSFEAFENWILDVNNGKLDKEKINKFNAELNSETIFNSVSESNENVLTKDDLIFWEENGFVIIKDAISNDDCKATVDLICNFLRINENDASTWYKENDKKQGIMVQLFQHEILEKNRNALKIKKAYEQLWQRKDIWVNTDRVGFNPPETNFWKFPGPNLHWDVSLATPIPFGLQGILYLTNTDENQGAFCLIPGFNNTIEKWLSKLPTNKNPRVEILNHTKIKNIKANAGDFIIWHHKLPHGSSANSSNKPRFVQYINYSPLNVEITEKWI